VGDFEETVEWAIFEETAQWAIFEETAQWAILRMPLTGQS